MITCPDCHSQLELTNNQCKQCHWLFEMINEIPCYLSSTDKKDPFFKKYLENYKSISVDDLQESIQNEKYLKTQNEKLASYIPPTTGLDVCEIGVGKGLLLDHLVQSKPNKLVGIDISIPYMHSIKDRLKDRVELIVANAEVLPYNNEFDVIIAADIIEHVINVGDFLTSVNNALKPGGRFIVKTPFNEDINAYSKLRGCKYDFVHLRNFNKKTLSILLAGAGFQVDKVTYDGFHPLRIRDYIKNNYYFNKWCSKYIKSRFTDDNEVNQISNALGRFLMRPIEMTCAVTKMRSVEYY